MKSSFINQTAIDYDLNYETVRHMYNLYWPNNFYKKLEEIISLRNEPSNQVIQPTQREGG